MALAPTCAGRSGTQGNPLTCWSEKVVVRLGLYLVEIVSKRASGASKWGCGAAGWLAGQISAEFLSEELHTISQQIC